jgi:hypothetical protein
MLVGYSSVVTSVHYCTRYTLMMNIIMHEGVLIDIFRAKTSNDSQYAAAAVACYSCRAITDLLAVNRQVLVTVQCQLVSFHVLFEPT